MEIQVKNNFFQKQFFKVEQLAALFNALDIFGLFLDFRKRRNSRHDPKKSKAIQFTPFFQKYNFLFMQLLRGTPERLTDK